MSSLTKDAIKSFVQSKKPIAAAAKLPGLPASNTNTASTAHKNAANSADEDAAKYPSLEELLDLLVVVHDDCVASNNSLYHTTQPFVDQYAGAVRSIKRRRVTFQHFEIKKKIAEGALAEIFLGTHVQIPNRPFAIKRMNKCDIMAKLQCIRYSEELEFLSYVAQLKQKAVTAPSNLPHDGLEKLTTLWFAFHDREHLYLVTDFFPGGDLLRLLEKYEYFPEEMARFYIAQCVVAIETIHKLGYVHRDIKIENLLLNSRGQLAVCDFGSCIKLQDGLVPVSDMAIAGGTAEYNCPELVKAIQGDSSNRYGACADWWSLGVVLHEMLFGETPFYGESVLHSFRKILSHETKGFSFENERVTVSDNAMDLIEKLCTTQDQRLGANGVDEIKAHPFFEGLDWSNLRDMRAPFIPELASPMETTFFDTEEFSSPSGSASRLGGLSSRDSLGSKLPEQLPFLGYYYACSQNDLDCMKNSDTPKGKPVKMRRRASDGKFGLKGKPLLHTAQPPKTPEPAEPEKAVRTSRQLTRSSLRSFKEKNPVKTKRVAFEADILFLEAARNGSMELLKKTYSDERLELQSGTGMTALSRACLHGHLPIVQFLVEHKAQVNTQAQDGCTPLHLAVLEEFEEITEYLLQNGADMLIPNEDNETALNWAEDGQKDGCDSMIQLLRNYEET